MNSDRTRRGWSSRSHSGTDYSSLRGTIYAACVVLMFGLVNVPGLSSANAGTIETRIATVNPDSSVYEWITHDLHSDGNGQNVYIRFDRVPESLYVKWVKCGYSATQDGASSVGGRAVYVRRGSSVGGAVGTNFRNGSCVRLWARAAYSLSYRPSYPIEAYFDYLYHP